MFRKLHFMITCQLRSVTNLILKMVDLRAYSVKKYMDLVNVVHGPPVCLCLSDHKQ